MGPSQRSHLALVVVTLLFSGAQVLIGGCQGGGGASLPESPSSPSRRAKQADPQLFAPLRGALTEPRMPFLLADGADVIDTVCFEPVDDVLETEGGPEIEEALRQHSRAISKLLRQWVRDEVAPTAVNDRLIDSWSIRPLDLQGREIDDAAVRFSPDIECIDSSTGWMEDGVQVVAGFYGASSFQFKAKTPLGRRAATELLDEFTAAGFTAKTGDLVDLELVRDDDGELRKGDSGEKLYRHPTDGIVSELDVTPPARQRMKTWTVESPLTVWFGFRELSNAAWRREAARDRCNVNIVWGDPVYRPPNCEELSFLGFKAMRREQGVEIQMRVGEDEQILDMDFRTIERLQIADRIILWVAPIEIEEGAEIRINSVTVGTAE